MEPICFAPVWKMEQVMDLAINRSKIDLTKMKEQMLGPVSLRNTICFLLNINNDGK